MGYIVNQFENQPIFAAYFVFRRVVALDGRQPVSVLRLCETQNILANPEPLFKQINYTGY